jgi:hypothetical protein
MRGRRVTRIALLGAAAWAGVVAGHSITYLMTVPQAGLRNALLASTGHSYWFAAVAAALVLAALAAGTAFGRGLRRGMGGSTRADAGTGVGAVAARLALLQVGIYVVQEVLERLQAGVPLSELARDHILLVGIPIQILVALAISVLLVGLRKAGEQAGSVLRAAPLPRPSRRHVRPPRRAGRPAGASILLRGIRGPPAPGVVTVS